MAENMLKITFKDSKISYALLHASALISLYLLSSLLCSSFAQLQPLKFKPIETVHITNVNATGKLYVSTCNDFGNSSFWTLNPLTMSEITQSTMSADKKKVNACVYYNGTSQSFDFDVLTTNVSSAKDCGASTTPCLQSEAADMIPIELTYLGCRLWKKRIAYPLPMGSTDHILPEHQDQEFHYTSCSNSASASAKPGLLSLKRLELNTLPPAGNYENTFTISFEGKKI